MGGAVVGLRTTDGLGPDLYVTCRGGNVPVTHTTMAMGNILSFHLRYRESGGLPEGRGRPEPAFRRLTIETGFSWIWMVRELWFRFCQSQTNLAGLREIRPPLQISWDRMCNAARRPPAA